MAKRIEIPYTPQARQQAFHTCAADEVLYGGAAGGGKSEAILFDALANALAYEGCRIIVFRRTFPDLKRSLIARSLQVIPKELGRYRADDKTWTFINGSTIEFAYWDDDSNYTNYQGAEYDFIYWDELTQFKQEWYTFMLSRLRGNKPIKRQVKSATNPGGIGHGWVKARFIDPAPPETVWRPEASEVERNLGVQPLSRCFIPAKVWDNPILLQTDPGYLARLASLPDDQRRAFMDGDWNVFSGQVFREWRPEIHVTKPFQIPHDWMRFRAIDFGYSDPFCCLWFAVSPLNMVYVYRELYVTGHKASDLAQRIVELSASEDIAYTVADPSMWNKTGAIGESIAETFAKNGVPLLKADNDRLSGKMRVHEYLAPFETDGGARALLQVFDSCVNLIRTLPALPYDAHRVEDVDTHAEDHCYDALRYGLMSRPRANTMAAEKGKTAIPFALQTDDDGIGGYLEW